MKLKRMVFRGCVGILLGFFILRFPFLSDGYQYIFSWVFGCKLSGGSNLVGICAAKPFKYASSGFVYLIFFFGGFFSHYFMNEPDESELENTDKK